ncbi:acyltransferase family protein [Ferrovibrio sp.]|uniref:acyltransferase family protein n=1 Tax=Ferrovibrio sp. TaxID=1917215 RepID=UPI0035AEAC5F
MKPPLNQDHRIDALTGIRFLAAITVAVAHGTPRFFNFQGDPVWLTILHGFVGIGMSLFFVLSGFVIFLNYGDKLARADAVAILKFLTSRFARIYPLFFILFAIEYALGRQGASWAITDRSELTSKLEALWETLPYYLTMTHSWVFKIDSANNLIYQYGLIAQISWSIATEWYFYLVFPVFTLGFTRLHSAAKAMLALLGIYGITTLLSILAVQNGLSITEWSIARFGSTAGDILNPQNIWAQDSFLRWLLYFFPLSQLGNFLVGALSAKIYLILADTPISHVERRAAPFLAIGSITLLIAMHIYNVSDVLGFRLPWPYFFLAGNCYFTLPIAYLIFTCARHGHFVSRFFGARWLVYAGEASYSIYLLHMAIFSSIGTWFVMVTEPVALWVASIRFFICLLALIILARGCYEIVERPTMFWLRSSLVIILNRMVRTASPRRLTISILIGLCLVGTWPIVSLATSLVAPTVDQKVGIRILSATYGKNCKAQEGNATNALWRRCGGKEHCEYKVDVGQLGDPAPGCGKEFEALWTCPNASTPTRAILAAEAGFGSVLQLSCKTAKR